MHAPDRPRAWVLFATASACTLGLSVCGRGGADTARLDRLERRVDVLETRLNAGAPPASAPPAAPGSAIPAGPPNASTYQPGAIAVVHAAPANVQGLSEPSADSVGGFVYTGGRAHHR